MHALLCYVSSGSVGTIWFSSKFISQTPERLQGTALLCLSVHSPGVISLSVDSMQRLATAHDRPAVAVMLMPGLLGSWCPAAAHSWPDSQFMASILVQQHLVSWHVSDCAPGLSFFTNRSMTQARCKPQQQKRMLAERWHAPRLSLYESLREPEGLQQLAPPHSKGYLLKWDLDITRFHTEDLVCSPSRLDLPGSINCADG